MTNGFAFPPPEPVGLAIAGSDARYPVHRIFCVGRNYADHAKEMGVEVDREAPFYFLKPATAAIASGSRIAYPPGTTNYHYEMELVVALGAAAYFVAEDEANDRIFGYATGLDMTRRDLQLEARQKGRPWDLGKAFEQSGVFGAIVPRQAFGVPAEQRIALSVNGATKQSAKLSDLIWSVPQLIVHLSRFYHLGPGDLIMTGTPAGVGPVVPGDEILGTIDGLPSVSLTILPSER
jgi:fumarylpyruvate hydrolase